jgi:predicted ATP-grasp superfamily ATP-dependent carboligase
VDVLVYEHAVAGALGGRPAHSSAQQLYDCILREGEAMWRAVAADFAAVPGVRVHSLLGVNLTQPAPVAIELERVPEPGAACARLFSLAAQMDAVVVIAPECDGVLRQLACGVTTAGGRLWSPSAAFIEIAMDKQETCERLRRAGVPVPQGMSLQWPESLPSDFPYPAVLKPRDGAGSFGVCRMERAEAESWQLEEHAAGWRLERWHAGKAASVAVLSGPERRLILPAASQRLAGKTGFEYRGGRWPLEATLQHRAARLANAALDALPPAIGYIGIDLILGDETNGRDDVVIEVNPRYTTSYTGLRAASRVNLAELLIALQSPDDAPQNQPLELSWHTDSLEFDAAGKITRRAERRL